MTRPTRSDRAPRGLGVDEDTVRRWEKQGLNRAEVLPGGVRPVLPPRAGSVPWRTTDGLSEPPEEDLPVVHVGAIAED